MKQLFNYAFIIFWISEFFISSCNSVAQVSPSGDRRFKSDILLIVAHPDDETAIGSYLAKAIYDLNKKVAVVYITRGTGGGNSYGIEQSNALGLIREIEGRQAVSKFGITNVWFLDGQDTPGQDVFHSLQNWGHGKILEQVIRIVRLTQPEVIISWLPGYVAGENHGDHQAAGVIATEAFDLSGNPTIFPTQIAMPREPQDISNFSEGLSAWQAKKIYYFSDASHPLQAPGPAFDMCEISKSKKIPYYRLAAELHLEHLTQADVSTIAQKALQTGDFNNFKTWLSNFKLIFGKSLVKSNPDADVFDGIDSLPIAYQPRMDYQPETRSGFHLELGGAFAFYQDFWKVHALEHLGNLVSPEMEVAIGSYVHIPLLLVNGTSESMEICLVSQLPEGWQEVSGTDCYQLNPHQIFPVQTFFFAPSQPQSEFRDLIWHALRKGKTVGEVRVKIIVREWTLPQ